MVGCNRSFRSSMFAMLLLASLGEASCGAVLAQADRAGATERDRRIARAHYAR